MVAAHQLTLQLVPRVETAQISRMLWHIHKLTYCDRLVCGRWCVEYIPRGGSGNAKYVVTYRGHVVYKVNMYRAPKHDCESMRTLDEAQRKLARYLAEIGIEWDKWVRVESLVVWEG